MKLSRDEQETLIHLRPDEPQAIIYTTDPVWVRRLQTYVGENPQEFSITGEGYIGDDRISITVECPKKLVQVRKKSVKLTDEQKEAARERLRKMREDKKND